MSSFQETFASTESEFVTVGRKNTSNKSRFQQLKPSANTVEKPKVNIIQNLTSDTDSTAHGSLSSAAASDTKSDDGSTSSRPRGPRRPPSGIFVNLGKEWKDFVRGLIPNKSSKTKDETVMNEISKVKSNPKVSNFEFKKIVCMIFHQALKTDRNTLVDKIINCWTRSGYNIIELIDSTYDGCKPMTQACWSGSIYCIQRLVAADPSGSVLYTVHPTKNETILDTLMLGKNSAIQKDPATALFSSDRFEKCEKFIKTAITRLESSSKAESVESICPELKESIDGIIESAEGSDASIVDQLTLKLVDLYLEDQSKSEEYLKAVKVSVKSEIFNQVDTRLKDEGIELVA
jgi:hypothetical protein